MYGCVGGWVGVVGCGMCGERAWVAVLWVWLGVVCACVC